LPGEVVARDLVETSLSQLGCLNFHHAEMQETLADLAREAGVEVRRAAEVVKVAPGKVPQVWVRETGVPEPIPARLVVGADGRASRVREWAGFQVSKGPDLLIIASTLHENVMMAEDAVRAFANAPLGYATLIFPIGANRFRTYFVHRAADRSALMSGGRDEAEFVNACAARGMPGGWFCKARRIGPLASFHGAMRWAEHPYHHGVALIGDAAGASDPSYGAGLSLTLMDARALRDHPLANEDWDTAGHAYAAEHDMHFGAMRRLINWTQELLHAWGPVADVRRTHAFPHLQRDHRGGPTFKVWGRTVQAMILHVCATSPRISPKPMHCTIDS
jgi:2-polyprenyl-6-methoxyphenol hydroxylase-like FAD-dependent oxidoreductase